ncbi:MAG: FAD-dependent oxidoreductase [Candidatus Bathyarchaeia archaeon]
MNGVCVEWPYPVNYERVNEVEADVLVIGGGVAGSWAAMTAAKRGVKVAIVEQMDVFSASPAGCDHWTRCYDNPACMVKPDEAIRFWEEVTDGFFDGIGCYVIFNESYKTLLEFEKLGAKIRDTEDLFKGAPFRDEETKLLYAYDYDVKSVLRVWGTTFRQAMYEELVRLRIPLYSRILVTSLLTEDEKEGVRVVGAIGVHTRTGEFYVFKAKAVILSTGYRDWAGRIFNYWGYTFQSGLSTHSPNVCGAGIVLAWRAGAELTLLDKMESQRGCGAEKPSYGGGSSSNTWFPCNLVDAKGKEVPWIDNVTGKMLTSIEERTKSPLRGYVHKIFGVPPIPPEPVKPISHSRLTFDDFMNMVKKGEYTLPLYADLPSMPEHERRAIFGLMVANEGKTWIFYKNMVEGGFDPDKDMLQVYCWGGDGKRIDLDPLELGYARLAGGVLHDWDFKALGIEGLYVAGEVCFGSCGYGGAAVEGRWAGAKASEYAKKAGFGNINWDQVDKERQRVYAPTRRNGGIDWKELNVAVCKVMRTHVNDFTNEELLKIALKWFKEFEEGEANRLAARNPHELARTLETLSVMENAKLTLLYMLEKKRRGNVNGFLTMKLTEGKADFRVLPPLFWLLPPNASTYRENYEKHKPW